MPDISILVSPFVINEGFNLLDLSNTLSSDLRTLLINLIPVRVIIIRRTLLRSIIFMKRIKLDIILLHQRLIPPQPIQQLALRKSSPSLTRLSRWNALSAMFDTV